MRLVPSTGAVVLVDLPEVPEEHSAAPTPDGRTQGRRMEDARHCLTRLSSCWLPGARELSHAPLLRVEGTFVEESYFSFSGRVSEHPEIPDGHLCLTSVVIAYDGRRGSWARTVSRWYRLCAAEPAR